MISENNKRNDKGLTLIEILIVIAIIGILLGIVLLAFSQARARARDSVRASDLRTLISIMEMYKIDQGRYPTSTIDFQIEGYPWGSLWEGYGVIPKDPLSPRQDYVYVSDQGRDYQIYAKFEIGLAGSFFACTESCGPNAEYNGGIASDDSGLIAFEPPLPPPPPPPPPLPEPIVCADLPLASGERKFGGSGRDNPRITQVIVNPLDVDKFASQTVKVSLRDSVGNAIFEVTGEAQTNNMSFPFALELVEGSETDGVWQGAWHNEDEYCQNFMLIIVGRSLSGTSRAELTFR